MYILKLARRPINRKKLVTFTIVDITKKILKQKKMFVPMKMILGCKLLAT